MRRRVGELVARADLTHAVDAAGLAQRATRLVALPAEAEAPIGSSRMGGVPDVLRGFSWPRRNGVPLAFLLQLDLADLRERFGPTDLPDRGLLLFFYDAATLPLGDEPSDDGGCKVIHLEAASSDLERSSMPSDLPEDSRFHPARVQLYQVGSLPGPSSERVLALGLREDERERYREVHRELDPIDTRHQILGEADPVQSEMELEPGGGAGEWRLLLQMDSDEVPGMLWHDGGRLYFWIPGGDLRAGRFDRVRAILQSY